MKTFDDNWYKLKTEDYTLPDGDKPLSMTRAEDVRLVIWYNNTKQQKVSWRDQICPYTGWVDLGDSKGLWRPNENRLYEEIQADYAVNSFGHGYKVYKSTARLVQGQGLINLKFIHVEKDSMFSEVFLLLDGQRIFTGKKNKIKGGESWKFSDSTSINEVLKSVESTLGA